MSLKKSVVSVLLVLSTFSAQADQIGWGNPNPFPSQPTQPSQPSPWPSEQPNDPWGHGNDRDQDRDRYDRVVELEVRRYFDQRASLDLLIDSYSRNQLLGKKIRDIKISMATEMGRGQASVLVNNRQLEAAVIVSRDVREYSFRVDSFSNEVGRSLRSLSLEMQGRFYVDKVVFNLESNDNYPFPFPVPSQTEILRQQINQTFEREGGLNLFRQFPLLDRMGKTVRRVNIVAMSRGYSSGSAMLLENSETFGQTQYIGNQVSRISFDLRPGERIGRELQSLRLQFNGSITVLEISLELDGDINSNRPGDNFPPREPRMPRQR